MTKQELLQQIRQKGSFLCVGLDPDPVKMPQCLLRDDNPILEFNKAIIDATAPYTIAYKPNLAFYECLGLKGWEAFERTVQYIRQSYPEMLIIADAKRGDIGNTSKMYAKAFFDDLDVDAVTVAPYMGEDSVTPFLGYKGKWVVLLALTSNKGAADFQMLENSNGTPLFENVIKTSSLWASDEQLMYVVGATKAPLFEHIRRVAPSHFLLVPGVGAQGGSLEDVCKYGITPECGLIVNSSRAIIYASSDTDFANAAAAEASKLRQLMTNILKRYAVI